MQLSLADAETLVVEALVRNRVGRENARSVAVALVTAEAAGQDGHGLRRVPAYAAQARAGKTDGFATPVSSRPFPAILAIDARNGYAYPALDLAVEQLPALARQQGIALAAISRSHHAGVMGLTVERFADQGLVALMVANAPAAIAPWGGRTPVFGTNPIAFAAPLPDADPLVIDLALSRVARGKVMAARQTNTPIPADWAFGRDGKPTTDAEEAMAGTMIPAGEAKGAALAMMVEILAAGLTGANFAFEASSLFDDAGPAPALGHMIIAINPVATSSADVAERLALLADTITSDPNVRLPGRRGQSARRQAVENGVIVDDEVIAAIRAL